jgi:DNA-damage-inducible protein J
MASTVAIPTTIINFRTQANTKKKAVELFKQMGLDMSSALNMFLAKVVETRSIPFRVTTVNNYPIEFEKQLLELSNEKNKKQFKDTKDLMLYLNS